MVKNKLPDYFRDYLDEKFNHISIDIQDLSVKVDTINGNVRSNTSKIQSNSSRIKMLIGIIFFFAVLLFPELREAIVKAYSHL